MNESAAGEVLLLRAYERSGFAPWTEADRAWASRAALGAVGSEAPGEQFLAARAQLALRRLEPLDPPLARWRALRPRRVEGLLVVLVLGFAAGALFDRIGSAQRINLLAPPVWALIAWNLAVYAWLGLQALLAPASTGGLRRAVSGLLQRWRARGIKGAGGSVSVWQDFAAEWAVHSLPLNTARIALALHVGAAALALGVLAGMYLRGLVLDYRVGWESTFLDAGTVQAALSTLLAPASAVSGIAVPDVQALRVPANAAPSASAAPWIHLYAWQLLLVVVLPRLALALWAAWRARGLQRQLPLSLQEPYFQRLLFQQHGGSTPVRVWPHAHTPDAAALATLKTLFTRVFGEGLRWQVAPTVAYGAEDEPGSLPAAGTLRVALFDLGATPEPESQGRLMQTLALPALMLVDEGAFAQRFGAASPRRAERRAGWSALGASLGVPVLFVDLRAADLAEAEAALQAALTPAASTALSV
jgi:Protein of unknown function (DUF2868)